MEDGGVLAGRKEMSAKSEKKVTEWKREGEAVMSRSSLSYSVYVQRLAQ